MVKAEMTSVKKVKNFSRDQSLRWFGHMERIDVERAPVKAKKLVDDGLKKGRSKKKWKNVREKDLKTGSPPIAEKNKPGLVGQKYLSTQHCWNKL